MRIGYHERVADILDIFAGTRLAKVCAEIIDRPWDASKSTAQPPVNCDHIHLQYATKRERDRWVLVCKRCGLQVFK